MGEETNNVKEITMYDATTGEELMSIDPLEYEYPEFTYNLRCQYKIDYDKVKTIDDIKSILKELNFIVYKPSIAFTNLESLLKEID